MTHEQSDAGDRRGAAEVRLAFGERDRPGPLRPPDSRACGAVRYPVRNDAGLAVPRAKPHLPENISPPEATFLIASLARLKRHGFGRLVISVSDGRVVDVEVVERVHRDLLRTFSPPHDLPLDSDRESK